MDWTRTDDRYEAELDGHELTAYRTPGRKRGWTLEIDGVPDEGLTGCSRRGPQQFRGVQRMLESVARSRLAGGGLGRSSWAGVRRV